MLLLGCRSLRKALASICRILSRVTEKSCPTSSNVCSESSPIPNLLRRTFSSLIARVESTFKVWSLRSFLTTDSIGETTFLSSINSLFDYLSTSPIGVSIEIGSLAIFKTFLTLSMGRLILFAISSGVGSRPSS